MHRRRYLAALGLATATSLAGCSGGGEQTDGGSSSETGATDSSTETPASAAVTETATDASTTAGGSTATATTTDPPSTDGLPAAPAEETPGTPEAEFTTSADETPIAANTFTSTLEGQIQEKEELMTAYVINTLEDQQTVELTYVADESNQREYLEAFAESFVETVARTGGTGGWMLDLTVQTGADREVWYTWQVRDEWAVDRLTDEISRDEFYNKIEESTATPTQAE